MKGIIHSYIHLAGRIGALVEVNCETDFVAECDSLRDFAHDLCLHIAAASPHYLRREDIPKSIMDRERDIIESQLKDKPPEVVKRIVDGKLDKFYADHCLMEQPFIKNPDLTITDCVKLKIQDLGENIIIRRFTRYAVGGE